MFPSPHRRTDSQLQRLVLCRHLAGLAELLPETRRREYIQNCEQLLCGDSQAFQHVGQTLGEMAGQVALPKELLCLLLTSLRHLFGEGEGKRDLPEPARRGSLWVNLGLLQIQTWLPQARFDPAVKRKYKLKYAKEEVWTGALGAWAPSLTGWVCLVLYIYRSFSSLAHAQSIKGVILHELPCDFPAVF